MYDSARVGVCVMMRRKVLEQRVRVLGCVRSSVADKSMHHGAILVKTLQSTKISQKRVFLEESCFNFNLLKYSRY